MTARRITTEACRLGWEGLIAKRADAPYRPGRTRDWLKFKCLNSQEFAIGGYTDPQRSRIGFGALLLGYYDRDGKLHYAGKVGTGFDRRTLTSLHGPWPPSSGRTRPSSPSAACPDPTCTGSSPSLSPRSASASGPRTGTAAPRFQGLRRDKDPAEVVREMP